MAERGHCSAFVVDTHMIRPAVPPRLKKGGQRSLSAAQTLLFLLVALALCGMIIEACFIYRLYQTEQISSATISKLLADETSPTRPPGEDLPPSKPVAHLTDGADVEHHKHVMRWSMVADPILHKMKYENGTLIIQEEGYYYVYSKVFFFLSSESFTHEINVKTERYTGGSILLLQSRNISPRSGRIQSNSFLGGVFHLYKNDAVYVHTSNTARIARHKSVENVFGAYMI
ncbi:tumor necrosis factor ligand superfamily member 14 [Austrofundulus limnaeus]|uniref:Tumor necrosis factor ligand superfamily member 14 n=1 Tax=Austrofundulus limnaeus TaxID=52670 RepID=A0A2I4CKI5_AUSLI|nr:PREDICTED: tumor necrosis factor ligand superfamily member 14-like [Austrofundulus limnaeus]